MTTDTKTPDPTPALMSAARLAEIRERARLGSLPHVAELLAHLDALTLRAPVDGEALPALEPQHTPTTDRFDGEVWRGRVKVDDDWAHVAVRTIDGATVPMFYWHGKWRPVAESFGNEVMAAWAMAQRAAGRSEGEAERARLADALECMRVERDHFCAEKDRIYREEAQVNAEIASLTAERDAMAAELTTIRRLHDIATGNREAARAEACAVIDRLGAEVAKRDAEVARLTAERDAAEQLTAAAIETGAADRERALNAEQERDAALAELAEARGSAKRWASLAERNGEDAMAHAARAKGLTAELAERTKEREEARAWVRRLTAAERVLTCAFCGEAYPPGTPDSNDAALLVHVKVCTKHPMRDVEREHNTARCDGAREERALCLADIEGERLAAPDQGYVARVVARIRARGEEQGS